MRFGAGTAGLTAVVLVALAGCGARDAGGPEDKGGPAPSSTAAVKADGTLSSPELQGRWWTWAASEPEATNAVTDPDGSACGRNQPQDVWFLAGTFGGQAERACEVPGGRPVVVPVVNLVGDGPSCADFMRAAWGTVLLDGEEVEQETYEGDEITVEGVGGNPVTGEEGSFTATGCGLWVRLPSLDPGKHTLRVRGGSDDFAVGVDYALTVT
jgi:hypothetical protein